MDKLELIENKEKNTKLEFQAGTIALIISLIFVFSNHLSQSYQIYFVIILFFTHQIIQSIIFNKWNFKAEYTSQRIWLRIIIIAIILILVLLNFATIHSDYSFYINLPDGKKANTVYSIAIYCGIYFIIYLVGNRKSFLNTFR